VVQQQLDQGWRRACSPPGVRWSEGGRCQLPVRYIDTLEVAADEVVAGDEPARAASLQKPARDPGQEVRLLVGVEFGELAAEASALHVWATGTHRQLDSRRVVRVANPAPQPRRAGRVGEDKVGRVEQATGDDCLIEAEQLRRLGYVPHLARTGRRERLPLFG